MTTTLNDRERLLVHDAVSTTVDTALAAVQQEIARASATEATGRNAKQHEAFIDGLRAAEGAVATSAVAARSAALHATSQLHEAA